MDIYGDVQEFALECENLEGEVREEYMKLRRELEKKHGIVSLSKFKEIFNEVEMRLGLRGKYDSMVS